MRHVVSSEEGFRFKTAPWSEAAGAELDESESYAVHGESLHVYWVCVLLSYHHRHREQSSLLEWGFRWRSFRDSKQLLRNQKCLRLSIPVGRGGVRREVRACLYVRRNENKAAESW